MALHAWLRGLHARHGVANWIGARVQALQASVNWIGVMAYMFDAWLPSGLYA